ncbi:hypothetical protein ACMU_11365 [Actibacterium mucosum KCTC 23349]|uniref:Methyltransferase domain-containing protein n=1 Tax=Actibacterium mucosum KCTC 23349 TaxID=1454373 RepID=A0A037ZFM9_9RHOB|nr:class I SAM-dependent methyltransferase [Actibacterium mucosum]KAJ55290.1 hypothetical protein ACMU_11365 [Actibacterium mucosum KCTC 23349]
MHENAAFWDKIADKYAARPIADMDAYEYTLNRTRSYLGADDHVLELGAGTGGTARLLAPGVGQYTATDLSPAMVAIGQRKAAEEGIDNLTSRAGTVEEALADETPLDAVLGFNILHLLPDQAAVARLAHKRLRSGGYYITKTPSQPDGQAVAFWLMMNVAVPVMRLLGRAPYVNLPKITELEAGITAAGFEIIETGNYPAKAPPARYIVARKL